MDWPFLDILHWCNHIICALWWLASFWLSIMFFKIHTYYRIQEHFISFYCWVALHRMAVLHVLYPLISWQPLGLFPFLGYHEYMLLSIFTHKSLWGHKSRYEGVEFLYIVWQIVLHILCNYQTVPKMTVPFFFSDNKEKVNSIGLGCSNSAHLQEPSFVKTDPWLALQK